MENDKHVLERAANRNYAEGYEAGREDEAKVPVITILEDVAAEICENYCKHLAEYESMDPDAKWSISDEGINKLAEDHCDKCPLNRLLGGNK